MGSVRTPGVRASGRRLADRLLALDTRTLAQFRICLASVLLINLATRVADFPSMYADTGAMPLATVREHWATTARWSLHWLSASPTYQAVLFGLGGWCALLLLIGLWTRVSTVMSWVLLVSLHTRVPLAVNGGDVLLVLLLFWAMFVPLGQAWSVDSWLSRRRQQTGSEKGLSAGQAPDARAPNARVLCVGTAAILMQVAIMYGTTGYWKFNDVWLGGEGIANALHFGPFTTELGRRLARAPAWMLAAMSHATLWTELLAPLLLFSPWRTRTARVAAAAMLGSLHVGILLAMRIPLFSLASLAALTLFLPPVRWREGAVDATPSHELAALPRARRGTAWLARELACGLALAYVLVYNALGVYWGSEFLTKVPASFFKVAHALALDQRWNMFDRPGPRGSRFAAIGRVRGSEQRIELLLEQDYRDVASVAELSVDYGSSRWIHMLGELLLEHNARLRHPVAEYVARRWNEGHPDRAIAEVEFQVMMDPMLPGEPPEVKKLAQLDLRGRGEYRYNSHFGFTLPDGPWELRYDGGAKAAAGCYDSGREEGPWTYWHESGQPKAEGQFVDGELDGIWSFWDPLGAPTVQEFRRGEAVPVGSAQPPDAS